MRWMYILYCLTIRLRSFISLLLAKTWHETSCFLLLNCCLKPHNCSDCNGCCTVSGLRTAHVCHYFGLVFNFLPFMWSERTRNIKKMYSWIHEMLWNSWKEHFYWHWLSNTGALLNNSLMGFEIRKFYSFHLPEILTSCFFLGGRKRKHETAASKWLERVHSHENELKISTDLESQFNESWLNQISGASRRRIGI